MRGRYNVAPLLAVIRKAESKGDYDAISFLVKRENHPPKPLTKMTVGEILNWQSVIDRHQQSEAAGAYQIMEDTLQDLAIPRTAKFNKEVQDKLAIQLLNRRGLNLWLHGTLSDEAFGNRLAREWAGLPLLDGPYRGKSYYDNFNTNKATVSPEEVIGALKRVKQKGFWSRLWQLFRVSKEKALG